jgi:7-keto-8-aminopelargonate synthetase-like enzyme
VCFVDADGTDPDAIVEAVNTSGRARIFTATVPPGREVIRAAITNYKTTEDDIDALIAALDDARTTLRS